MVRLYSLLEKNSRKSHRYEMKTVFDILGILYERNENMEEVAYQRNPEFYLNTSFLIAELSLSSYKSHP